MENGTRHIQWNKVYVKLIEFLFNSNNKTNFAKYILCLCTQA